jgi:alkanesulfonate monooxygenase SsuD/methylene tetrahydromethanopterin reductase-like flavin-dependent oxidoreductase (luciferase family)
MSALTTTIRQEFKFGIFDWIDFSDPWRLAESYDQRFEMLQFAEQRGYWCYHLAEHHFSSLGGAPSPSVFLAAAAKATTTIRVGSLVHILPMYSPVRLAQEVVMLDHLSHGRFELGLGRGIRPEELRVTNIDPERVREVYDEAFSILLKELSTGTLGSFEGKHYRFGQADAYIRPYQRPYPPLWYPTNSLETAAYLGRNAINTMTIGGSYEELRNFVATYMQALEANQDAPDRINAHVAEPKCGAVRVIYVDDNEAAAIRDAKRAYSAHAAAFTELHRLHSPRYDTRTATGSPYEDFEEQCRRGWLLVGTPAQVRERVLEQIEATGINYMIGAFAFGAMSTPQLLNSIGLFSEEVLPALAQPGAPSLPRR